ncbi:putative ABC transporter ATP-binding protein [Gottschalkia purinilytica]|uniref:Putative ABC transporter ATP-binding protein n=1 Tax=Gottschalkia purinilytica TaxID=1503 RepID=A0A0L0W715_GOTPU|nr:ATP-binding cassette domain-containing protein [Gottschalkia purinilytica]KNF07271.1 putative ABC transporter ATP-binding protein [Gottschalkia purinilytica]
MNVHIRNLKKYYNEKNILNIDEIKIDSGKITGILGPNGAGKSTLLNIIAGLDDIFTGDIRYDDRKLNKNIYKNITLVSQKPYLFKRTVYENILYPLKLRGFKERDIKDKVRNILEELEITNIVNKKANLLSGGESQKVSLARALVFEPRLLLLDEPTSNIDVKSLEMIERKVIQFNKKENSTIVIVTHNLNQAERMCDEIINIENGKVGF